MGPGALKTGFQMSWENTAGAPIEVVLPHSCPATITAFEIHETSLARTLGNLILKYLILKFFLKMSISAISKIDT